MKHTVHCDSWLSAEEGNRNMGKRIMKRNKGKKLKVENDFLKDENYFISLRRKIIIEMTWKQHY